MLARKEHVAGGGVDLSPFEKYTEEEAPENAVPENSSSPRCEYRFAIADGHRRYDDTWPEKPDGFPPPLVAER